MKKSSRLFIAFVSLSFIGTYYLPIWFIYLLAPQYPEGLTMQIWLNRITGEVDIINGLNHYIGMKHISADMFPEFSFLVYIIAAYIILGLIVAAAGKTKWLSGYLLLLVAGGIAAMVDFYRWGYEYGHDLDPKAAIQIPGFSYQPPVIGHKTVLNFDAYSYPDAGGWIFITGAVLLFAIWFVEHRRAKKKVLPSYKNLFSTAAVCCAIFIHSCTTQPSPFNLGKDLCDECRMTIVDQQFGGELITKKGKIYKFDDLSCLKKFTLSDKVQKQQHARTLVIDYDDEKSFIDVAQAYFVSSEQLTSPMLSNTAAVSDSIRAAQLATQVNGHVTNWETIIQSH